MLIINLFFLQKNQLTTVLYFRIINVFFLLIELVILNLVVFNTTNKIQNHLNFLKYFSSFFLFLRLPKLVEN
jgi:hypothetical protein